MNRETAATPLRKTFEDRTCGFSRCRRTFEPKADHQVYCCDSHRALAHQERKLKKMIAAALRKQRRQLQAKNAN